MKNSLLVKLLISSFILFGTGCHSFMTQKRVETLPSYHPLIQVKSIPVDLRLARTITTKTGDIYICDQPATDVARGDHFNSKVKLSEGGTVIVDGGAESQTSIIQLNGRSAAVLLARDILYHQCISRATGQPIGSLNEAWGVVQTIAEKEAKVAEVNQNVANSLILQRERAKENAGKAINIGSLLTLAKKYQQCIDQNKEKTEQEKNELCSNDFIEKSYDILDSKE